MLRWSWLGRVPYPRALELQERLRHEVQGGGPDRFLLLEHPPVFTLGRNASDGDVVADPAWLAAHGVDVHETNRGGQVTYHGPGQLVGYPIINLSPDRRDVRRYVRDVQEALIRTLAVYGVEGCRRDGQAFIGIWAGDAKIASIGVHLARWVTIHGFALNVATDLRHFDGIVACGLRDVEMTSIERVLGSAPPLTEVAAVAARELARVFERELVEAPANEVLDAIPDGAVEAVA